MRRSILIIALFILVMQLAIAPSPEDLRGGEAIEPTAVKAGGAQNGSAAEAGQGETGAKPTLIAVQEQNKGDDNQIQNKVATKLQSGEYIGEGGQQIMVQAQANEQKQLSVGGATAQTTMTMTQEQAQDKTVLKAQLSNGRNAEIKVMPDTASEKAIERLQLKGCTEEGGCSIELKEVGKGDAVRAAYEVQAQKESRVLGIFKAQMQVKAQIDAETGEVISAKKPWWAFLASE